MELWLVPLSVILAEKGTIVKDFSWKMDHFSQILRFSEFLPPKFGLSQKIGPMFKDFFFFFFFL